MMMAVAVVHAKGWVEFEVLVDVLVDVLVEVGHGWGTAGEDGMM